MKRLFPLLILAAFVASGAAQSGRKNVRPSTQPLPPVQAPVWSQPDPDPNAATTPAVLRALPDSVLERPLKSLDDSSFRLVDFDGKVVVVNIWASWCGPCRSEAPEYEKVRREYVGREVEFIALTIENPRTSAERVKQFVRKFNFGFRHGWADRNTADILMNGKDSIPQTLVIARDGRIVSHWAGYRRGSGDSLRAALEGALSGERRTENGNQRTEVGGQKTE